MIRKIFVDREKELKALNQAWEKQDFSFIIIYGRRRIGKTRLILEFLKKKKALYYLAVESSYETLAKEFSELIKEKFNIPISGDIIEVIDSLTSIIKQKIVIVLDEFQYIANADKSFISKLQRAIDTSLNKKNLMLIVCGSSVSFFEKELLGYKSPVFGRRTYDLHLKPLTFDKISQFFPKYNTEQLVQTYGVVGGTPAYLEKLDPNLDIFDNIRKIISPESYLYDEALNLLRQEVREPRTYFTILSSIARGHNKPSKIANIAQIDPRSIGRYVALLEELNIVRRIKPIGYRGNTILDFADNYFRFYFNYIFKLRSLLEFGEIETALNHIKNTFNEYLSKVYEGVIEELVPLLYKAGIIKTMPIEYGKWWHRDKEIDLVIREPGKSTTFVEIKWKNIGAKEAEKILEKLESKSDKTGLKSKENLYLLVAKQINGKDNLPKEKGVNAIDLADIETILAKNTTALGKNSKN